MALKLACPHCERLVSVPEKLQGQVANCPKCQQQFRVPLAPAAAVVHQARAPQPHVPQPHLPRDHSWLRTAVAATVAAAMVAVGGLVLNGLIEYRRKHPPVDVAEVVEGEASTTPVSVPPVSSPTGNADPNAVALATKAQQVLKDHCHRCHGQDGVAEGGFNFVLRRDRLVSGNGYVTPGKPDDSFLLSRIVDKEMPPPGDGQPVTAAEIDSLRQWIAAGAPDFAAEPPRQFVANADIVRFIRTDLEQIAAQERRHTRYFTLTNLFNAGFSGDEMQTYRLALGKLVNSLSWNNRIVEPKAIDPQRTIYRVDVRTLGWDDTVWQQIIEADPYSVKLDASDPDGKFCLAATQCELPHVRADWFVAAASKPPLYHQVLQIPATLKELLSKRFPEVDIDRNIQQQSVRRVGISKSGVSQNNRLLEWHRANSGYIWVSYDFAGNVGRKNLFQHPLGPGSDTDLFDHDGGEIIFSLPNGLQGYLLVDAKGNRIDKGPTSIVSDPRRPDRAVTNGVSCMACHYAGIISKGDDVRRAVEINLTGFSKADQILALYPPRKELDALYEENSQQFRKAVNQVGIEQLTETGEPVVNMAYRFDTDVDSTAAAAELGLSVTDFIARIRANPRVLDRLAPLAVEGGTVKRELFAKDFAFVVEALRLGVPLKAAETTPKVAAAEPAKATAGVATPATAATPAAAATTQAAAAPTTPPTDQVVRLRTFTDRSGRFKVDAELVDMVGDKVRLKKADNTQIEVSPLQLSDADQKFVTDELAKLPPSEGPPAVPPAGQPPVGQTAGTTPSGPLGGRPAPPPRAKPPARPPSDYRLWTNLAIGKRINGAFISLKGGELKIEEKRYRGAVTRWPMEHLSPEDHAYVIQQVGEEYFKNNCKLPNVAYDPFREPY